MIPGNQPSAKAPTCQPPRATLVLSAFIHSSTVIIMLVVYWSLSLLHPCDDMSQPPVTPPKVEAPAREQKKLVQEYAKLFWLPETSFLFSDLDLLIEQQQHAPSAKLVRFRPGSEEDFQNYTPDTYPHITVISPHRDLVYLANEQQFAYWQGTHYRPIDDGDQKTGGLARLTSEFLSAVTGVKRTNVNSALIGEVKAAILRTPLTAYSSARAPTYVSFNDGILNLSTFTLLPHDPTVPVFRHLPISSEDFVMPTPVFDAFLETTFPDSPEMRDFLIEMLAYYFLPHDREPAAFFLYGAAASGKSTILDLMRALLSGRAYYSAASLKDLTTDKFVAASLAGKLANIYDEDESGHVDLGKLKALISHVPIDVQRKFQDPFTLVPYAKFIFAANQLPRFSNVDQGVMRRIYPIEFNNTVPIEKRDKDLKEKLLAELPGIVGKLIRSGKAFVERGQNFIVPQRVVDLKEEFRADTNPVIGFILENYEIPAKAIVEMFEPGQHVTTGTNPWIKNDVLYQQYVAWTEARNQKPFSQLSFFRQLGLELPTIEQKRFGKSGERYKGLIPKTLAAAMIPTKQIF